MFILIFTFLVFACIVYFLSEYFNTQSRLNKEARLRYADAENFLEVARLKSDSILSDAKSKADYIYNQALAQSDSIILSANSESSRILNEAREYYRNQHLLAEQEINSAHESAKNILDEAFKSADIDNILSSAHNEASKIIANANDYSTTQHLNAEKEILSARECAQTILADAYKKADVDFLLSSANAKASDIIHVARSEATEVINSAKSESDSIISNARTEAKSLILDAQNEIAKTKSLVVLQSEDYAKSIVNAAISDAYLILHSSSFDLSNDTYQSHLQLGPFCLDEFFFDFRSEFIAFDFETTGLSPELDRVVEIGAVHFRDGVIIRRFSTLVKSPVPSSSEAYALHHISSDMLSSAPSEEEAFKSFYKFLGSAVSGSIILVAHNGSRFDMEFLTRAFRRYSLPYYIRYVDTLFLAQSFVDSRNHKLPTLAKKFRLKFPVQHRAENDASVCGFVFLNILSRFYQPIFGLDMSSQNLFHLPDTSSLEVCKYISSLLADSGCDINQLYFLQVVDKTYIKMLNTFISFRILKRSKFIFIKKSYAVSKHLSYQDCYFSESYNYRNYVRFVFRDISELSALKDYFVQEYSRALDFKNHYFSVYSDAFKQFDYYFKDMMKCDESFIFS